MPICITKIFLLKNAAAAAKAVAATVEEITEVIAVDRWIALVIIDVIIIISVITIALADYRKTVSMLPYAVSFYISYMACP